MARGDTHIVLVNGARRELLNRKRVGENLDLLAGLVETRTRDVVRGHRVLGQFVSIAESQMAQAAGELVDFFQILHGEDKKVEMVEGI